MKNNASEIKELDMDRIQASPMNTFNEYPEEQMSALTNSIDQQDLIEPIIVRPGHCCESYSIQKDYEIIAGHNRYKACSMLGRKTIRCSIVDADDIKALLLMAQSNIQRPISEIEIARNCRKTYELMKRGYGGDRKSNAYSGEKSSFRSGNLIEGRDRTMKEVADLYGVGQTTMHRRIRLTDLADEVFEKYLRGKLTQEQAVQISYADKDMQIEVLKYYSSVDREWITDEKAAAIGRTARKLDGKITPNQIREIMQSNSIPNEYGRKKKDRSYPVPARYFPDKLKLKDRPMYITKALEYVQTYNVELKF